jgi:hypothetical protein
MSARDRQLVVWMYFQGHIEHLRFDRRTHGGTKRWSLVNSALFDKSSALALTARGATFAAEFLSVSLTGNETEKRTARDTLITGRLTPRYKKNEFSWGCHLLKHFTQQALSQRLLLEAFEEDGWSDRNDNPFTGGGSVKPKARLHDTIQSLNHYQKKKLIRFYGDGTGQAVGWEYR